MMGTQATVYIVTGHFVDDSWVVAAFTAEAIAEECRRTLEQNPAKGTVSYGVCGITLDPSPERWEQLAVSSEGDL